jgi:hypothetical protein
LNKKKSHSGNDKSNGQIKTSANSTSEIAKKAVRAIHTIRETPPVYQKNEVIKSMSTGLFPPGPKEGPGSSFIPS